MGLEPTNLLTARLAQEPSSEVLKCRIIPLARALERLFALGQVRRSKLKPLLKPLARSSLLVPWSSSVVEISNESVKLGTSEAGTAPYVGASDLAGLNQPPQCRRRYPQIVTRLRVGEKCGCLGGNENSWFHARYICTPITRDQSRRRPNPRPPLTTGSSSTTLAVSGVGSGSGSDLPFTSGSLTPTLSTFSRAL